MEDWIVVNTPVTSSASVTQSNGESVPTQGEALRKDSINKDEHSSQLSTPETRGIEIAGSETQAPDSAEQQNPEPPTLGFNDMLYSMDDFQRVGLGLYDLYADQIHGKFNEFKELATTRSRWALERAREESQRLIALIASEDSDYDAPRVCKSKSQTSISRSDHRTIVTTTSSTSPSKGHRDSTVETQNLNTTEFEQALRTSLVAVLVNVKAPLYDGCNFKEWFAKVSPYFDKAIPKPEQTCERIVCGVKLCSLPGVAATMDEIDFSGVVSKEEVIDFLNDYFNKRNRRVLKYEHLLRENMQT